MSTMNRASSSSSLHCGDDTLQQTRDASMSLISPNEQMLSPTTSTTQDRVFTIFGKLPNELQNIIWAFAACEPRIVEIRTYTKYLRQKGMRRRKTELRFISRTLVPAILHAAPRSREVGLRYYERLCFGGNYFTGTYVNWSCDYLRAQDATYEMLSAMSQVNNQLSDLAEKCKRLIVPLDEFESWSRGHTFKNLDVTVLLSALDEDITEARRVGNIYLVQPDDSRLMEIERFRSPSTLRRTQKIKALIKFDELTAFSATSWPPKPSTLLFEGRDFFSAWDAPFYIEPFQKIRSKCKSVMLMGAIRGMEEGMTKELKAERRREEKEESQREYRLAHPEIAWHDYGFSADCPCFECSGTGSG